MPEGLDYGGEDSSGTTDVTPQRKMQMVYGKLM